MIEALDKCCLGFTAGDAIVKSEDTPESSHHTIESVSNLI
jgi:hypothetical protein